MKGKRGITVLSAACLALTGLAGTYPVLPVPAVVYAAEQTAEAAVPAEAEKYCADMLGKLELYQADYFASSDEADIRFVYYYVSGLLETAGKKDAVPHSEYEKAVMDAGFSNPQASKEKLAEMKDGTGKPVYDSETDTVSLKAPKAAKAQMQYRILSVQRVDNGYAVSAAVCEPKSGDPKTLDLIEYADYCDYDAEKNQYYLIGQPLRLGVSSFSEGKYYLHSYEKADYYIAGGKLYALMHSETENKDYKMSYSPVNVKVQVKDALTGELKDVQGYLSQGYVYDEDGRYVGTDGRTNLTANHSLGSLNVVFPKDETRLENGILWKTEAGEFTYELLPGKGCTVEATCTDAKGTGTVKDNLVQSSGDTELTFTITKDPQLVTSDQLSTLFTQVGWYYSEVVTDGGDFQSGEAAPDSLVIHMTEDALYQSPYKSELTEIKEKNQVLRYYTVPYKTYMEYADQLFAKHSDLKEILGERYDSKTDTVKVYVTFSGSGGLDTANVMVDYVEKDGLLTVRGATCIPESEMTGHTISDDDTENVDYFTKEYPGYSVRYTIQIPREMTVRRSDLGYQIVSYMQVDTLRIGDLLTSRTFMPDPVTGPSKICLVLYPVRIEVLDAATGLPVETKREYNGKTGELEVSTADGNVRIHVDERVLALYDDLAWRFYVDPMKLTVTGNCTVSGIDGDTLRMTDEENTYELAGKKGMAEFVVSVGKALEMGDMSGDGEISVDDAQLTLKAYTKSVAGLDNGLNPAQEKAADINGDGIVTVEDAQLILKYYTGKYVAGKDITWDDVLKK